MRKEGGEGVYMGAFFWIIGLLLYVGLIALFLFLFYFCIKKGVKDGIVEAYLEIHKNSDNNT